MTRVLGGTKGGANCTICLQYSSEKKKLDLIAVLQVKINNMTKLF